MPTTFDRGLIVRQGALPGAMAGLIGGAVFAVAMLRTDAAIGAVWPLYGDAIVTGILFTIALGVIIGAGFGFLAWHQRLGVGETLFWGLTYAHSGGFWGLSP